MMRRPTYARLWKVQAQFGMALRSARRAAGMTLDRAAKVSGIERQHIWRLEHGHHAPNLTTMLVMARTYRTTVSKMLEGVC